MKFPQKSNRNRKKIVIVIASILVLIAAAFLVYFFLLGGNKTSEQTSDVDSTTRPTNDVDYSGASEEDVATSQDGKKNSSDNNNTEGTPAPNSNVTVGITFADVIGSNVEIRAFTPSVIEGDGKCTATLTKGTETVTQSSPAFIDATSTQCEPIYIDVAKFPSKGVWSLKVDYSSSKHKGVSEISKVTIS
jgi:flagellar basal body-associated protein FliL